MWLRRTLRLPCCFIGQTAKKGTMKSPRNSTGDAMRQTEVPEDKLSSHEEDYHRYVSGGEVPPLPPDFMVQYKTIAPMEPQ